MTREVTIRVGTVRLGDDGVVRQDFVEGAYMEVADSREAIAAVRELTGDVPAFLLTDMRHVKGASSEARAFGSTPEMVPYIAAIALLTSSPLTRMIANFFVRFTRPAYPVRMFTDRDEALAWLLAARTRAAAS